MQILIKYVLAFFRDNLQKHLTPKAHIAHVLAFFADSVLVGEGGFPRTALPLGTGAIKYQGILKHLVPATVLHAGHKAIEVQPAAYQDAPGTQGEGADYFSSPPLRRAVTALLRRYRLKVINVVADGQF